ncbi:sensor histidine kinase [Aquisalimonas sp.]|uniref:sensor histidine kinase n=1 Tax=unclassified Aquisalimonas TaxID=2644645 RepID=UPI0025BC7B3D|nr:sensor histidine kinase [Aquisalimonas sp.]
MTTSTHITPGFLPDFCNLRTVLAVVVIAELLVFVLVLAQPAGVDPWQALSLYSLYVQWVALGCTVLLCLLRNALNRLPPLTAGLLAWLLVMAVTALVAHLAWTLVLVESEGTWAGFMLRSLGLAAVVAAVALRYLYLQQDWRWRVEAASAARVQALQARIRPHFLFNSLNTIAAMIRSRPRQAEAAVEDLADLFRASLESGEGLSTLDDELALAQGYLNMEQLRLGDRLQIAWETDNLPGQVRIPSMTLQPLLENAVYHGIEPRRDGGRLVVSGRVRNGVLQVCVRNPLPPDGAAARGGFGIAQDNVRERLRLAYGDKGHLSVRQEDDCYSVCLTLPCDPREARAGHAERGREHAHSDRG